MKKFILGITFCAALLMIGGESADGEVCVSLAMKLAGCALLALTAVGFRRWHIGDGGWVRRFIDD